MRGKSRTQEECAHEKWRTGTIPEFIEISVWIHVICTIMVQPIQKN